MWQQFLKNLSCTNGDKMEIKLKDIRGYITAIEKMSAEKMPLKVAFKLAKLKKELAAQGEFYDENYRKIIFDCAELDENGTPISKDSGATIQIKEGKMEEINSRMKELNELTCDIGEYKFKVDDFGEIKVDAGTLEELMDFIEE